jgi:hypothetical protein
MSTPRRQPQQPAPRHPSALLESTEAAADEEERQYKTFMHEEALKARREEEQSELEARRENDAKTAEGAYTSALSVIDGTIERAQTYGERMLGMHGSSLTDEQMCVKEQPRNLRGQLRDYQLEGFRWIVRRAFAGESIILADEMGLGASWGGLRAAPPQRGAASRAPPPPLPAVLRAPHLSPSRPPPHSHPPHHPLTWQARRCRSFPTCAGLCCKRSLAPP